MRVFFWEFGDALADPRWVSYSLAVFTNICVGIIRFWALQIFTFNGTHRKKLDLSCQPQIWLCQVNISAYTTTICCNEISRGRNIFRRVHEINNFNGGRTGREWCHHNNFPHLLSPSLSNALPKKPSVHYLSAFKILWCHKTRNLLGKSNHENTPGTVKIIKIIIIIIISEDYLMQIIYQYTGWPTFCYHHFTLFTKGLLHSNMHSECKYFESIIHLWKTADEDQLVAVPVGAWRVACAIA